MSKIRLLGDVQHNAKIAFVEFATAESARGALKLSGALLGALPCGCYAGTPRLPAACGGAPSCSLEYLPALLVLVQFSRMQLNTQLNGG